MLLTWGLGDPGKSQRVRERGPEYKRLERGAGALWAFPLPTDTLTLYCTHIKHHSHCITNTHTLHHTHTHICSAPHTNTLYHTYIHILHPTQHHTYTHSIRHTHDMTHITYSAAHTHIYCITPTSHTQHHTYTHTPHHAHTVSHLHTHFILYTHIPGGVMFLNK